MGTTVEKVIAKAVVLSPILQIVVLTIGVTVSFLVAYFKGDVSIYLPFISETGAIVPEMGIFSATIICGSFFGVIVVYYRYATIAYIATKEERILRVNNTAFYVGLVSMAGLAGVAAFPMSTVLAVHLVTAGIHFGLAVVYLFLQTYISLKLKSEYHTRLMGILRLVLSFLLLLFLLLLIICFPISMVQWKKFYPDRPKATKVPEDEVFGILVASALFEWLFYTTFMTFTSSYIWEFRRFRPLFSVQPVSSEHVTDHS